jgi:hypothetical protein
MSLITHYVQAAVWDVVLICASDALRLCGDLVRDLAPIILFVFIFFLLEILKCWPAVHTRFLAATAPGNGMLSEWITLMFFALMVDLPCSLEGVPLHSILCWLGACVLGAGVNLVFSAYLSLFATAVDARWRPPSKQNTSMRVLPPAGLTLRC